MSLLMANVLVEVRGIEPRSENASARLLQA